MGSLQSQCTGQVPSVSDAQTYKYTSLLMLQCSIYQDLVQCVFFYAKG